VNILAPPKARLSIEIVHDLVCPWCFLGVRRLLRTLRRRPDLLFDLTWRPFLLNPDMPRADAEYFQALISGICRSREELDSALTPLLDRAPKLLDPIEHAVLLIGGYELQHRPEVPFRVVINEAVSLARRFGATDGHKYINGVLDRAAHLWRSQEH